MINAFKQIRLSGYNLLPQSQNGQTRLTINNTGVAYYQELTGVSGYLQGLINTANADVSSINGLQDAVSITGRDGIQIFIEGQNIVVSGKDASVQALITTLTNNLATTGSNLQGQITSLSGYSNSTFATVTNLASTGSTLDSKISTLSGYLSGYSNSTFATVTNLASTGSALDSKINTLSGYSNTTFATVTNLAYTGSNLQGQITSLSGSFTSYTGSLAATFTTDAELSATSGVLATSISSTGSTLDSKINTLSGYSNNTFATITNLASTGSTLQNNINSLSGTLTGNYVSKASQQQFIVNLPINIESTGITYPVAFASVPNSVQVTFEPSTDVVYMVSVKNRTTAGFTAEFSDVILEAGNKLNVFASI